MALPRSLGLPHEAYVDENESCAAHYRCCLNGVNVFVWRVHIHIHNIGGFYISTGRATNLMSAAADFHSKSERGEAARIDTEDHITLLSVIYELTSGGNNV